MDSKKLELKKLIHRTVSGGRGCLGAGRLGVPGQVWEFRFLPSFPSFPGENRSSINVGETPPEVPDILLPDIRGLLRKGHCV